MEWEESAYGIEIERAVNLGNDDLAAQLEALLAVEKRRLDQDFGKRFLPKGVAMDDEFANVSDEGLQEIIHDKRNGLVRARAIRELARRALSNHALLDDACRAISSDHEATGHHKPLGWAGADVIFLAGDRAAMAALLKEIKNWNLGDQRFLLLRWDVLNTEATIRDFESKYDCKINFPPYKKPESLTLPTKRRDERD